MNKRPLLTLAIIAIFIISILKILAITNGNLNFQKNGFNRTWITSNVKPINRIRLIEPITRICGATSQNYFLAGNNAQWLIMLRKDFKKKDTFLINVPTESYLVPPNSILVDSPSIYLHLNNLGIVILANLVNTRVDSVKLETSLFTRSIQFSDSIIFVRSFDSSNTTQQFYSLNANEGSIKNQSNIKMTSTKGDLGFASDGLFAKSENKIIYVQFYRNNFFCFDSSLNMIYSATTIDTITNNVLDFRNIASGKENKLMSARSRMIVNKDICVDNGKIYIYSALRADNETKEIYDRNSTIDIYSLDDGKYIGSILVPNIDGERIKKFTIKGTSLLALYKRYIASYEFEPKLILSTTK